MNIIYKVIFKKTKKEISFTKYKTMFKYIEKIEDDDSYAIVKKSNGIWFDVSEYIKG